MKTTGSIAGLGLAVFALMLYLPARSFGAQVVQYGDAAQGPVNTSFIADLINDNIGTTYQSATLDLEGLLGNVADYICQHSSDTNFAGKSHAEIFSRIFFLPSTEGEISNGWGATMNGTTLEITHADGIPGLDYTTWQSSSYHSGGQDMMRLYCTIPNSALNGNNLTTTTNQVQNAFSALTLAGATAYTTAFSYKVMTPPNNWLYTVNFVGSVSNVTITGYSGISSTLIVPDTLFNLPVTAIGDFAFSNRTSLTEASFADNVSTLGTGVFFHCFNLSRCVLPAGIASIPYWTFQNCTSLYDVAIPAGVIHIGGMAFMGCGNLTNITIPAGCQALEDFAFLWCDSLTNVFIPAGISHMGAGVFADNDHLLSITTSPSNLFYSSTNDMLFCKDQTALIQCPAAKSNGLSIPATVVDIGDYAFASCFNLTAIAIPRGVTNIGPYAFYNDAGLRSIVMPATVARIGDGAFAWCTNLTNMTFKGDAAANGAAIFDWDNSLTVYYYPWTSGWSANYGDRPTQVMPTYTQWLTRYGFATNRTEDSTDYDKDGMLNWQEYLAGTNPTNKADSLIITTMGTGANTAQISWQAKSNVSYQVMKNLNLMAVWGNAPSGLEANQQSGQTAAMDGLLQYADPDESGPPSAFYRVNVAP